MTADNIWTALQKLEAGTIKKRDEGVNDLRQIFNRIQSTSKIHELREYDWHKILDTLFALVKSEKHDLLSGSPSVKKKAASRLPTTAEALRLTVNLSTPHLRHKTAYAVLDHVNDSLDFENDNEGTFRQLVLADYVKILRTVLSNKSHGEHLRPKDWERYVDLVLAAVHANLTDPSAESDDDEDNEILPSGSLSLSIPTRTHLGARTSQNSLADHSRGQSTQSLEDLMLTLANLTSISNSHLIGKLGPIADTVLKVLSKPVQARATAFRCLNNVLLVALTEDILLVSQIATRVIPLVRYLWSSKYDPKATSLHEQMLATLLLLRHYLQKDALSHIDLEPAAVELLAQTMSDEYESRNDQNSLQISDVVLSRVEDDNLFQRAGVAPDLDSSSATFHWTTVAMIAMLRSAYGYQFAFQEGGEVDEPSARKRQKRSLPFADLVCWLMLDMDSIDLPHVIRSKEALLEETSNDQTTKASWALFVLARLSRTSLGQQQDLNEFWLRVWKAASNLITSQQNSRAACFAMMSLIESGSVIPLLAGSDLVEYCFHGGIRGPTSLTDSALLLFSTCLRCPLMDTERRTEVFRDKVLAWLDTVWLLPITKDHSFNCEVARMGQSFPLHDLLRALIGEAGMPGCKSWMLSPPAIYQMFLNIQVNDTFAAFNIDPRGRVNKKASTYLKSDAARSRVSSSVKHSRRAVSDFLLRKLENFRFAFRKIEFAALSQDSHVDIDKKRRANLSLEIAEIMATACTVAALTVDLTHLEKSETESIFNCWQCVHDFLHLQQDSLISFENSYVCIAQRLLEVWPSAKSDYLQTSQRRSRLVLSLQRQTFAGNVNQSSNDDMDLDVFTQTVGSQSSQARTQGFDQDSSRRDVDFSTSLHGLFEETKLLLLQESLSTDLVDAPRLASAVVNQIVALPPSDLLASRGPVMEYLQGSHGLSSTDASRLLRHVAKVCLEADEFERNEAALCYCLKVLTGLASLWVGTEDEDLADIAFDIYSWFIEVALGKSIASNEVLYNIANLLDCLYKTDSRYGTDHLPSARTSLLQILKSGQCSLKFRIVSSLTRIFEGYILTEHPAVFDDIVDRLPTEPSHKEGIAVRLYILARLGSRWGTVLRQAVYHIFETAANVPAASEVAKASLEMMATGVGLRDGPSQLLHLFAPQVFYTWLEEGSLNTVPFSAFGYDRLLDLVKAEKEELVAQAILRRSSAHKFLLEDMLQQTWSEVLEDNFPLAQVYALATDMVENKAGADIGPVEESMRNDLDADSYALLARRHLAEAVALVILSLSDDRSFDKVLTSSTRLQSMAETYQNIRDRAHSSLPHPPRQQPSFRAKYLMHILSKLCHTAGVSSDSLWSPALLVYVYRRILDDADAALGPLHIASVIRKIRIVVTLAGPVAANGYPFEMLLRALAPFLTHFHSSEDAIGIYWYLLEYGSTYLEDNLSFLLGLSVSTFVSLSSFATSSQQSTTQESEFVSTMSKVGAFRAWLGAYLSSLNTSQFEEESIESLQHIVQNAKEVSKPGTNDKNEHEGLLLYHLLKDQATKKPLVSSEFFRIVLRTLSFDFRVTEDFSCEIMSMTEDIIACVPVLWSVISKMRGSQSFLTWVGKILGKAYNIQGPLLKLALSDEDNLSTNSDSVSLDQHGSIRGIIAFLANLLWHEDAVAAGMAERTLSVILGTIEKTDRKRLLSSNKDWGNLADLVFDNISCPAIHTHGHALAEKEQCYMLDSFNDQRQWAATVGQWLVATVASDHFLTGLLPMLEATSASGESILPMLAHLALDSQGHQQETIRETLSDLFNHVFRSTSTNARACSAVALEVTLYLRKCIYPSETNFAARNAWLDIDFVAAAHAALNSGSPDVALLMLEIGNSEQRLQVGSRRSSIRQVQSAQVQDPTLLLKIFQRVSDEDFFYGSHEKSDINSVLTKLRHEKENDRVLALQSALFDASTKTIGLKSAIDQRSQGIVSALSLANLHGLAYATQQYTGSSLHGQDQAVFDDSLLNIHQWDVPAANLDSGQVASLQAVLQKIEIFQTKEDIHSGVNDGINIAMQSLACGAANSTINTLQLGGLAALSAVEQLLFAPMNEGLTELWANIEEPEIWISHESFSAVSRILMAREAVCAAMRRNEKAHELFRCNQEVLLLSEIKSVRNSLSIGKIHDAPQFCLNRAAYLSQLQEVAQGVGLDVGRAVTYDIAGTLWSQGEITAPIEMLQSLEDHEAGSKDPLPISTSELLTDLGQKLSQARLHRPDEITKKYLQPAIDALEKGASGVMTGRVYHNFAAFCDEQLRDSVAKDDFERISKIRNKKYQEINELAEYTKKSTGKERESFKMAYSKAKLWFRLDDEEYKRLKTNREVLLRNCLENYLLSMQACDTYDKDVLRFLSLWLGNPKVQANESNIREYLKMVPALKLAPFVNQLSSRLADSGDPFQKTLFDIFFRICRDHPFHGLYQLFSVFKSKGAREDDAAKSRQKAADRLARTIQSPEGKDSSQTWISVHNGNIHFVNFAQERNDKSAKTGKGIPLRSFQYGRKLEQTIQGLSKKIPPPTLKIALRRDKNYKSLPTFSTFEPDIVVAGGVSAPKITTIIASDGTRHKMLLKGGNDDLRQDAIMEQVFEQVSDLLENHRPTRHRKLGIRTYKVIPLTHNAGIIEFVKNTIPLHEYLLPAHTRYYPKDYKPNACRTNISNAQTKSTKERVKVFEKCIENFHPVMRFFFMERFLDPTDWFNKRLAYSRSTAAISILGHVLGLGDRHGHNILLDEKTGEVVHIDLGVAFEAGRVLPVPEVVPFRLTRDLVDGMGLSGVEGPFRRCCNFTLEALRKNQDVIMTILDVLRWDPLYSWSVSLLRVHRMQDAQEREAAAAAAAAASTSTSRDETPGPDKKGNGTDGLPSKRRDGEDERRENVNEPSEADRALSVVAKKLSAGLSVEATVNELIRQATDVENLAVLYCGWAAYA